MDYDFKKSVFYRTFMTSVFVGLFATILTMLYDCIFVQVFGFPLSAIINVASLIFAVNIIFILVGILYYVFVASFKKADMFYILLLVIITALLAWRSEHAHRTSDEAVNSQFRQLLTGIVLIMGVSAAFLVPYLY